MGAAATLEVSNLRVELTTRDGISPVIDDLSFSLRAGETLALVGESGCGKSMTALAVMGLLPHPVGRIAGGSIFFDGEDLVAASDRRLRDIRGNEISMIFQEPMTSLNPVYTIGAATRGSAGERPGNMPSNCSTRSAFPTRRRESTAIPIKCREVSGSA